MASFRNFSRRIFIIINLVVVLLYLLACANIFLHPARWWFLSLLGLVFPLILSLLIIIMVFALFFRSCRRWALVSLVALLIGWPNIHALIAFHPGKDFSAAKAPHALRILTWNVRSWDEFITRKAGASGHRINMLRFIGDQHADILCFQEFFECHNPAILPSNINYIRSVLHYPYYFFSRDYRRYDGAMESGVIIFSRYPIRDTLQVRYDHPDGIRSTESLIGADVDVDGAMVRVFTTHLQSVLFRSTDFRNIEIIKNVDDSILQASKSLVRKLRYAYKSRGDQALQVRSMLDQSPYPGIICGDFNDVPNSYTYFRIRDGWQDAFICGGFGIGRTYVHVSPTLRIDYILADPRLSVLQSQRVSQPYSDHNPVMADLALKP